MPCASQYSKLPLTRANVSAASGGDVELRRRFLLLRSVRQAVLAKELRHRGVDALATIGVVEVLGGGHRLATGRAAASWSGGSCATSARTRSG